MYSLYNDPTEELDYLDWLSKHKTDGYVANRWKDGTVMLHHAHCVRLTANHSYRKVTPQYSKLCADNLSELRVRVTEEWHPVDIRECPCWKGKQALLREHPVATRSNEG